jgi:hypothetical protein
MGSYTQTQGSSQPAQSQQYGGGLYNPLYGQLAQMMMYGGGGSGGYSPFFNAGYGYGMPQQQQQQQPFYQPAFWQSLLQNMYQPQTPTQTATGYIPSTDYSQMLAQANPGGQSVTPPPSPPPPPPPPSPPPPSAPETSNVPTGTLGFVDYSPLGIGVAHGGRIHHHALQIAADAAPPYSDPTAAAGRRFKSS